MPVNAGKDFRKQCDPVNRLVGAIRRNIELPRQLPDEFFPAHVSVALIDAVFNPCLQYETVVIPIVERYCRYFGLSRKRIEQCVVPPVDEQETLDDLILHYGTHGERHMREGVFKSNNKSPGTQVYKAENVLLAAQTLRGISINTLQDAQDIASHNPEEVKCALRTIHGINHRTAHMLLMYLGNDEFVKGDRHLCSFVRSRLADNSLRPHRVEQLVRSAAREIGVTPRFLDYAIWRHGATPFKVEPHAFGFKPEIDTNRLNQLADQLEVEEVVPEDAPELSARRRVETDADTATAKEGTDG